MLRIAFENKLDEMKRKQNTTITELINERNEFF